MIPSVLGRAHLCVARRLMSGGGVPKLNLVMDIDECMIHSVFEEDIGYRQADERTLKDIDGKVGVEIRSIACEDGAPVKMHVRPHLLAFLASVKKNYNVFAFTAALPVYARPVLANLDPDNTIFQDAWFRQDCTLVNVNGHRLYTKDVLKTAQLDPKRTVLVDNNIYSFIPIPNNGIHVDNFTNSAEDEQLKDLLPLLQHVSAQEDVRGALAEMFQLEERLKPVYDAIRAADRGKGSVQEE